MAPQAATDFIPATTASAPAASQPDFIPAAPTSQAHDPDFIPAQSAAPPSTTADTVARVRAFLSKPLLSGEQVLLGGVPFGVPIADYIKGKLDQSAATGSQPAKVASGVASGVGDVASGLTSPASLGLIAGTAGFGALEGTTATILSRLASAGFSVQSLEGAWKGIPEFKQAIEHNDMEGAARILTGEVGNVTMAGLAGLHAATGGGAEMAEPATMPGASKPAEEVAASEGKGGIPAGMLEDMQRPIGLQEQLEHIGFDNADLQEKLADPDGDPEERAQAIQRLAQNVEIMRELRGRAADLATGHSLAATDLGETNALIASGSIPAEVTSDQLRDTLGLPPAEHGDESAEESAAAQQGSSPGGLAANTEGGENPQPAAPQGLGEADIRGDNEPPRGAGAAAGDAVERAEPEANGGISPANYPIDLRVLGSLANLEETLTGEPVKAADIPSEGPQPPVISRAVDDSLANSGITVVRPGRDMWLTGRFLGSLSESARLLNQQGHPLGPILADFAGKVSDTLKAISRNTVDTMREYINGAKRLTSRSEWENNVVPLLDNAEVTPANRPPNIPDHIWDAYLTARNIDNRIRTGMISAKRADLILKGFSADQAAQWVPDNWGMQAGHYHHAFPGEWAITKYAGVDGHGNAVYEPIETGWRAQSEGEAKDKAAEYLDSNPAARLQLQQDTVSLPGSSFSDRAKLVDIAAAVKDATTQIVNGGNINDVMKQLYDESAASAYGPRRPVSRQFSAAMERESNLPGWARDRDNYERYLQGSMRYIELLPARQYLMQARNQIAQMAGMKPAQSIGEFPSPIGYQSARQYGNILARVDSSIEGLNGNLGMSDSLTRSLLSKAGLDPNLANIISRPMQAVTAFLKLGLSPVRILSHGLQSLWAVYPVLGEKATLQGYAHAYDPAYKSLIDELGATHAGNATDVDNTHAYIGNYFGRGSTPIDWTKGSLGIIRDLGMAPLTTGINFTRRMAAVGAYLQGTERGMSPVDARNYARDVMDRTTGMYSAPDNSVALRQLPATMAQFKNFSLKTGQFIWGLRTPGEIARFATVVGLMGYSAAPLMKDLTNIIHNITGEDIDQYIKKVAPKASRGIFGEAGIDIPASAGLGDLSILRDNAPLGGLAGPLPSMAAAIAQAGAEKLFKGPSEQASKDMTTALRNISPEGRILYDETGRLAAGNSSLTDPLSGAVLINKLTPTERAEMVAGFTPLRVAEERDLHDRVSADAANAKDKHAYFIDQLSSRYVQMGQSGTNTQQQTQLGDEANNIAKMAAGYGVVIKPSEIVQRIREMEMARAQRDIRLAPRSVRGQALQEQQP